MLNKVTVQLADAAQHLHNQRWKKVSLGKNFRGETANGGGVGGSAWSGGGGPDKAKLGEHLQPGGEGTPSKAKVEKKQ